MAEVICNRYIEHILLNLICLMSLKSVASNFNHSLDTFDTQILAQYMRNKTQQKTNVIK